MAFQKKVSYFLLTFLLKTTITACQTGLWLKVGASKKLGEKFEINTNIQSRHNQFKLPANSLIGEIGLNYIITQKLEIGLNYRYIHRFKKDPFHRYYADLSYKFSKIGAFEIDYRLRYQQQFKDDQTDGFEPDKNYWRNKIELAYTNKTKFEPFVSTDLFYRTGENFDQIRYKIGLNFKANKSNTFEVAAQTDKALNSADASQNRITLAYKIKL